MSFLPRTVDEVQQAYLTALSEAGSQIIIDQTQGSIAYTLSRAAAVVTSAQDLRLKTLEADSNLTTALSTALDNIGLSFAVTRKTPSFAQGFVLVLAPTSTSLAPSTILTDLKTGVQVVTTNILTITATPTLEVLIPVRALLSGVEANLTAGTLLYAEDYPSLRVRVGQTKTDIYEGNLFGGAPQESDIAYRNRIANSLVALSSTSESGLLLKLLDYPNVQRAFVTTRVGGFVELWVDASINYSSTEKTALLTYIRPFVAAGVIPIVSQANRKVVDFLIEITPFKVSLDLDLLTSQILFIVQSSIDELSIGSPLFLQTIQNFIAPLVQRVEIKQPLTNVQAAPNQVLVLGELKVTYPAQ